MADIVDIPKDRKARQASAAAIAARAFGSWRKRQQFATPDIATKAQLVEFDLHVLASPAGRLPSIARAVQTNIAEFSAMLAISPAQPKPSARLRKSFALTVVDCAPLAAVDTA